MFKNFFEIENYYKVKQTIGGFIFNLLKAKLVI